MKPYLQSQLSDEICKPITDHKSFVEIRDSLEPFVSMWKWLAACHTSTRTTQLQLILSMLNWKRSIRMSKFAKEQDRLGNSTCSSCGSGRRKDFRPLIIVQSNRGIFKPDEEAPEDDGSLQAALSAQVRKTDYKNRGTAVQDRAWPNKNQESRSPTSGTP